MCLNKKTRTQTFNKLKSIFNHMFATNNIYGNIFHKYASSSGFRFKKTHILVIHENTMVKDRLPETQQI